MSNIKSTINDIKKIYFPYDDFSIVYLFFLDDKNNALKEKIIDLFNNNIDIIVIALNNVLPSITGKKDFLNEYKDINDIIYYIQEYDNYKNEYIIYKYNEDQNIKSSNNSNEKKSYYPYAFLLKIMYLYYQQKPDYSKIFNNNKDELVKIYGYSSNNNLNKYGLLPLDISKNIKINEDEKFLEDSYNSNIFSIHTPTLILQYISDLYGSGFKFDLSFKILDINPPKKINKHFKRGKRLEFDLNKLPLASSFYNNIGDELFIKHEVDKKQIIFEEVLSNPYDYEDNYITQVIHLIYDIKDSNFLIIHIDHEYISYEEEEYIEKTKDIEFKGSKVYKTFKIDNANIPFFHKNIYGEYFLYTVLFSLVENKNLVQEYFQKII